MSHVLESRSLNPSRLLLEETLFHCANGYLGVRGTFEEGYPDAWPSVRGSYVNAFYDTHAIVHPERLFGFPETGEKIANVTDAQTIGLWAGGERVLAEPARVRGYLRSLDIDRGTTRRSFVWRSSAGAELEVDIRRLVSLSTRELFAVEYRVAALGPGPAAGAQPAEPLELELVLELDGDVENFFDPADPRVSGKAFKPLSVVASSCEERLGGGRLYVESRTAGSGLSLGVLSDFTCVGGRGLKVELRRGPGGAGARLRLGLGPGEEFRLTRMNVYADSARHGRVAEAVLAIAAALEGRPFDALVADQERELAAFWARAEVSIEGDPALDEGLRFNLYQLLQSAPTDGASSIPAKGLSGEGYEGHYFWDAEIYMLPFFCYTNPPLARGMLLYRHATLEGARAHAREMGQKRGAAFPWRTIAGRECSAYYPSGSAQYHISADVAYAVWRYYEATDDLGFLVEAGAELLFETARLWLELGHSSPEGFRIEAVTGPDEYT
ncbi:MAG TPA: family 65 glycosyl hydrolase, partial [Rectinemataceae bacterium]|nr:family 65 glycosyl hydrolase [Rectinemataceae bacterium]